MFLITTVESGNGDDEQPKPEPKRFWCTLSGWCLNPLSFDVTMSEAFDVEAQQNPLVVPCMLQLCAAEPRIGQAQADKSLVICSMKGDELLTELDEQNNKALDMYTVDEYTIPEDTEQGDDLLFTVVEKLSFLGHLWKDGQTKPLLDGSRARQAQSSGPRLFSDDPLNPVTAALRRAAAGKRGKGGKGRGKGHGGRGKGQGGRGRGGGGPLPGRGKGRGVGARGGATSEAGDGRGSQRV